MQNAKNISSLCTYLQREREPTPKILFIPTIFGKNNSEEIREQRSKKISEQSRQKKDCIRNGLCEYCKKKIISNCLAVGNYTKDKDEIVSPDWLLAIIG